MMIRIVKNHLIKVGRGVKFNAPTFCAAVGQGFSLAISRPKGLPFKFYVFDVGPEPYAFLRFASKAEISSMVARMVLAFS